MVSREVKEAEGMQPRLLASLEKTKRFMEERDADQWTPALRSIAVSTQEGIDLRVIHVWRKPDDPQGHLLQIEGVATGAAPRAMADQFLQGLRRELGQHFQASETCRFERLEDEPDEPSADRKRATFTIMAPIGAPVPPKEESIPKI